MMIDAKTQAEMKRKMMPMSAQRYASNPESLFMLFWSPFITTTKIFAEVTKKIADSLQSAVFHEKVEKK